MTLQVALVGMLWAAVAGAQPTIKTIAGGGPSLIPSQGVPATSIGMVNNNSIQFPALATDNSGNLYVADPNVVYRIDASGKATVVAGNGLPGFNDGSGPALSASFGKLASVAVDGNYLYMADIGNLCVWQVDLTHGSFTRFAGTPTPQSTGGVAGWNGDGGPAVQAGLAGMVSVVADHHGSVYILTFTGIRQVNIATGLITSIPLSGAAATGFAERGPNYYTASGSIYDMVIDPTGSTLYVSVWDTVYGIAICSGETVSATAFASYAEALAIDPQGNVYAVSDAGISKIPGGNGTPVTLLAGVHGYALAVDSNNNLFYLGQAQSGTFAYSFFLYKTNTSGVSPVIWGSDGSWDFSGDGAASQIAISTNPGGIAADPSSGVVYFSDTGNQRVRKIVLSSGTATTIAGTGTPGSGGDGGQAISAQLNGPTCLALDATNKKLYITDSRREVRVMDLTLGTINTLLNAANTGAFRTDNPALGFIPTCIALDGVGNLYISETDRIDKYTINGGAETNLIHGISGPNGLAADASGNVYLLYACQISQLSNGQMTTIAGTGVCGDSGDGGPAIAAQVNFPTSAALDGHGNLLIADGSNRALQTGRIRRIALSTQTIYAVTSAAPHIYYSGESGPLACAQVVPNVVASDGSGNIFIAETTGRILEGLNYLATPQSLSPITINAFPGADGLGFSIDGMNFSSAQNQNWTNGANHTLAAAATSTGLDGYAYSFVGWNDGNASASRGASASCTATFTAMYNAPGCSFYLSNNSFTLDDNSYSGRLFLDAEGETQCSWLAQSNNTDWLHLTSAPAGTGPAYITFQADSNPDFIARTGTLSVGAPGATQTVTVVQSGFSDCAYELSTVQPAGLFGPTGGGGAAYVSVVGPGCGHLNFSTWQGSPQVSWLHVTSQPNAIPPLVTYTVDPNTSSASRTGTILIGATGGATPFVVTQAGTGTTSALFPNADTAPAGGGPGWTEVVEVGAACDHWTAASNQPWITVTSGASGSGSGIVTYSVDANTGGSRNGTLTIAGQTYTVNQPAAACTFSLTSPSATAPIGGGSGPFGLTASSSLCYWSAISSAPWLSLTSAASGAGSITGGYSAAANSSGAARNATITIGGQTFTVNQAGANTQITIQTSPSGLQFTVDDGAAQTAPATVSLSAGQHTISVAPTQTGGAPAGTQFVFTSWSDGTLTTADTITVSSSSATYTATFSTQYQLTISAAPAAGGTVTPASGGFYNSGSSVPIAATANANGGYQFAGWTGSVTSASSASTTVTMSAPETVTANFTAATPITIQTSPAGLQFTVDSLAPQTAPATVNLPPGQHTITVQATQAGPTGTQYLFSAWSDQGPASHTITVSSSAATYTATFTTQYQLTISASPAAGGTVTPVSGGYYASGASVPISATANSGYQFSGWSGTVASSSSASTTVTMSAPETVTANFASLTGITIQTNPASLQFTVDGGAAQTAPQTLNLAPGNHTIATATTQAGGTGTQYVFASWSDAGAASHTITVGSSAASYTATFTTQYQLTISASPAAGGTVTPSSGAYYNSGASVPIAATVNSGYQFSGWSGTVASSTSASTTVTMSAPETVTANFASLAGITIQTSPTGMKFTVDGGAVQTAPQTLNLAAGDHTLAVASPQAGATGTQYAFASWSDGGAASHTITVGSSAATYTATFTTQYQLTISAAPFAGGTVTPASGGFYNSGTSVPIAAMPAGSYVFTGWTGTVASASSASTTVTMSAPESVTANFSPPTGITIQTTPPGLQFSIDGGAAQTAPQTLSLTPGSHTVAVATMQAGTTGTQYTFVAWSDSGLPSHSITVGSASATYIATFQTQYQLTVSAAPAGGGAVTPASGGFYNAGSSVPITATANTGYQFSSWSGTVANAASGSTTVTMSAPETVTANFSSATAGLAFYPVAPCRVVDTRSSQPIAGNTTRTISVTGSACNIPAGAQAYSLNVTVVPAAGLGYLTIWPAGQTQPYVSTLNSLDGRVVANAAIVPAGNNGSVSVYASDASNVILDINGYFAPPSGSSLVFYPVTPCRVVDTRGAAGAFGGPSLAGNATRAFAIPSGPCTIPSTAQAYSLNVTVAPHGPLSYLTVWPAGQSQPLVSTLNSYDGSIVANAAIVPAGSSGAIDVFATGNTDLILDINGYFAPAGATGALKLYTLAPCRVADTRNATGTFGGPALAASGMRTFQIPSSVCSVPSTAQAYAFNVTVVPPAALQYLTAWPAGLTQPYVSTLNSPAGKILANAAIVPAGTSGGVSFFASDGTQLVLDINAYFAP